MAGADVPTQNLSEVSNGIPRLSPSILSSFVEAASVCFENQGNKSGTNLVVVGDLEQQIVLTWDEVTEQMKRSYRDLEEAVEWGATVISFVLVRRFTEYTIIERSYKGTGFDYWLGSPKDPLFQRKARLEVSGILKETPSNSVKSRTKAKLKQINKIKTELPGIVVIVEFTRPLSEIRRQWSG